MQWSSVRDRIVEGRDGTIRSWILMNHKAKVMGIYLQIDSISKFVPTEPWEETLDGAKFRAELELDRYRNAQKLSLEGKLKKN